MDPECEDLCERIIQEIDSVFHKDPDLSSFEITALCMDENKTPVVHIEHNLGLESWCVEHVYLYAHRYVMKNKGCGPLPHKRVSNKILKYLNCALLLNPDMLTFWNLRRHMFEQNMLDIEKEFQFTAVLLTRKPKSNDTFAYRRWLFSFKSHESIDWNIEMAITERCALKYSSNYIAWNHRQWVLQKAPELLKFEFSLSEAFIRKRISDYSSYNHRQIVINHLLEIEYYDEDVEEDLSYLIELINTILGQQICTGMDDVIAILFENVCIKELSALRPKLFCLNLAAYDMFFCDDMCRIFGDREAFVLHRRATVAFIVSSLANLRIVAQDEPSQLMDFLNKMKEKQAARSEADRSWCNIFLKFDNN